jgi:hypothetical protein
MGLSSRLGSGYLSFAEYLAKRKLIPYESVSIRDFQLKRGAKLAFGGYNTSWPSVPMSIGSHGGRKLWNVKLSQIGYNGTKNFTFGPNSFAEFDYTLGYTAITTRNVTLVQEIIDYMNETFYPYKEDGTFIMPA